MHSIAWSSQPLFTHDPHAILGQSVPGICRQPILFECLRVVFLATQPKPQHFAIGVTRIDIALCCRQCKIVASGHQVPLLLLPLSQCKLSLTESPFCGTRQPILSFCGTTLLQAQLIFGLMGATSCRQLQPIAAKCKILVNLFADQIGLPQPQLGRRSTGIGCSLIEAESLFRWCLACQHQQGFRLLLSGGFLIPAQGKIGALAHPFSLLIASSKLELGIPIALFGGFLQPFDGFLIGSRLTCIPLSKYQLGTRMIALGRLLEPVETLIGQLTLVLLPTLHPQPITGIRIPQLGRALPPATGLLGALGLPQTSLIPVPHLQCSFAPHVSICRQGARLLGRLFHPAHRLGIIRLGRQTIGQLILRLALALLSGLNEIGFSLWRRSGTGGEPMAHQYQT